MDEKSPTQVSVGVLQCGEVPENLRESFIDYNEMVAQSLNTADPRLSCRTWRVFEGEIPRPDACDAWITTGSRYSVNDDNDWTRGFCDFVREVSQLERPFVGICYGMQMIAKALGGKVEISEKGWGIGIATSLVCRQPLWMDQRVDEVNLVVSHQEQVIELPDNAELIASSDFCNYSMFSVGRYMLGIQGHPEFTADYSRALMESRRTIIPADRIAEGLDSLIKPVNGAMTFKWIVDFIRTSLLESSTA
ncbi:MAG TPA: GMP synthase [Gammaproteobacteria bacterium]|nr:GMP synthase [Gammaproteobacteria bacterium]|tara:strand:- start:480 stop:1226 length:747 start_codon:yes stop_codon:yes gene_type:complete